MSVVVCFSVVVSDIKVDCRIFGSNFFSKGFFVLVTSSC